jgi:hypothetical protein
LAKQRLECPEKIEEELAGLRKDFLLNDKCKMIVLVSMATNGMIRLVSMYPEAWFMDTTAGEYEFILNMNSYFWRLSIHMHVYYNMNSYFSSISIHMHIYSPGVNRHKKELFVMAVRTLCRKTFPQNLLLFLHLKSGYFMQIFV